MTDIIGNREVAQFGDNKLALRWFPPGLHAECPDCGMPDNWQADLTSVGPIDDAATELVFDALFTCRSCGHEEARLFKLTEMQRGEGLEGLGGIASEQGVPASDSGGPADRDDGSV